jgi:hypothetical protein
MLDMFISCYQLLEIQSYTHCTEKWFSCLNPPQYRRIVTIVQERHRTAKAHDAVQGPPPD